MTELTSTELVQLFELLNDDAEYLADTLVDMNAGTDDFTHGDVRFISEAEIDNIMEAELRDDEYTLGCFNPSFLASVTGLDVEVFEAMHKAEAFEAVGKLIVGGGHIVELQADYVSADGYGHHFAHYDHNEHELAGYYAFKVN